MQCVARWGLAGLLAEAVGEAVRPYGGSGGLYPRLPPVPSSQSVDVRRAVWRRVEVLQPCGFLLSEYYSSYLHTPPTTPGRAGGGGPDTLAQCIPIHAAVSPRNLGSAEQELILHNGKLKLLREIGHRWSGEEH